MIKNDTRPTRTAEAWRETTTTGVLDELERKMYAHFAKEPSDDRLLNSQSEDEPRVQQTKGKNTFKLFTRPAQPMTIQELDKPTPVKAKEPQPAKESKQGKSQMGQVIEEVEAIEMLVRKKLALKQERVAQLQREIGMETEEKVHLYRTNCQLEQELQDLLKTQQIQNQRIIQEEALLQQQLSRLTSIYEERKNEGKKLKKEEELLQDTLKNTHNHRKGCLQAQIRAKNKQKPKKEERHGQQEQQYLRGLVVQLDRLKNMVKQKMRKERSRLKIK